MLTQPENTDIHESPVCKKFIKVPLCHQETPYTCGVACVQSILSGYKIMYTQDVLSELLKQKPIYGTDYKNIIIFMEMLGFQVSYNIEMNIDELKEYIDNGITPLIIIQAWKDDDYDYTYDWKNSHYVIACGYDDHRIMFMDPWTLGSYTFIPNNELMNRWHALDSSFVHQYYSGLIIKHEHIPFDYNPNIIKRMN